jgi:hypothetical protein
MRILRYFAGAILRSRDDERSGCPMIDLHQARFAHQRPVQSIL